MDEWNRENPEIENTPSENQPAEEIKSEDTSAGQNPNDPRPVSTYDPYGTEDEKPVRTYGSYGNGSYQSRSSYSGNYSGDQENKRDEEPSYYNRETRDNYRNDGYGSGRTGYSNENDGNRYKTDVDPSPIEPGETNFRYRADRQFEQPKKRSAAKTIGLVAGLAVLFGVVSALVFSGVTILNKSIGQSAGTRQSSPAVTAEPTPTVKLGNDERPSVGISDTAETRTELTTTEIVDMCMPSMVAITNTSVSQYRNFFGQTIEQPSVSAGSGIIVGETDDDLLIATNNHVISNSKDITVTFIGDEVVAGTIKGADSDADLAIVAVAKSAVSEETMNNIRVITIGDSDSLRVGETVVAIGNALGYGQSVSRGIVSALNRQVTLSDGNVHMMIQTDASINPGNSGGALLNMQGELVGINEIKYVNAKVEGVGYAIPMKTAEPILESLGSRAQRSKVDASQAAYIGIKCTGVPDYYVQSGYPAGVYLSEITPGGPAEAAGMQVGDIITAMDGNSVSTSAELINYLEYYAAGETIEFSVSRMNAEQTAFESMKIAVTLGNKADMPADDSASSGGQNGIPNGGQGGNGQGGGAQNIPFLPNN